MGSGETPDSNTTQSPDKTLSSSAYDNVVSDNDGILPISGSLKIEAVTASSPTNHSSVELDFSAAKRDHIDELHCIKPKDKASLRAGKGFYKILLQSIDNGIIINTKEYHDKLVSVYGKDSIIAVVKNKNQVPVCTRNESVLLQSRSHGWAKKLDPTLYRQESAFLDKPKIVLREVPTKEIKIIKSDVEFFTRLKLTANPIVMSNSKYSYFVLITFENHEDYVAASEKRIHVQRQLCLKYEYIVSLGAGKLRKQPRSLVVSNKALKLR
jgi:hypothetical protein